MFGVSHGALQFMTYEEMKNKYNEYRKLPINTKLVSGKFLLSIISVMERQKFFIECPLLVNRLSIVIKMSIFFILKIQ